MGGEEKQQIVEVLGNMFKLMRSVDVSEAWKTG